MKKKYSPFAMSMVCLFMFFNLFQAIAQKEIKGNGNLTKVEHQVDPFTTLEIDGIFNVFIEQGNEEKVVVEADENLHDYISIKSRGKKLKIDNERKLKFFHKGKMNIYVTVKNLERLDVEGVGNVESTNALELGDFELSVNGIGNVNLDIEADYLELEMFSVGNVDLSGKIKNADIENNGIGRLAAFELENEVLHLKVSGVGKTEVFASKEISIKTSGVGNVFYKGDATVKDLNVSGVGKVKKM